MSTSTDRREILKIGIDPGEYQPISKLVSTWRVEAYTVLPSPGSGAHQHPAPKPALAEGPALPEFPPRGRTAVTVRSSCFSF